MSNLFNIPTDNVVIDIKDDDGVDSGMTVTLCPASAPQARRAERKANDLAKSELTRKKGGDLSEVLNIKLAGQIVTWQFAPNSQWNGNPIPGIEYTEENALALLRDPVLQGIRDQIAEAVSNRSLFTKRSQNS